MLITIKAGDGTCAIQVECHELAQRFYAAALNLDDEAELNQLVGGWKFALRRASASVSMP